MRRWNLVKAFMTTMAWMQLQGISVRSMFSPVLFLGLWLLYEWQPAAGSSRLDAWGMKRRGTPGADSSGTDKGDVRAVDQHDDRPLFICAAMIAGLTLLARWPVIEASFQSSLFRLLSCVIIAGGIVLLAIHILRLVAAFAEEKTGAVRDTAMDADIARADATRTDARRADTARADATRTDARRADIARADATRTDARRADTARADATRTDAGARRTDAWKAACLTFVMCMLCYLPWFLYSYPGIMSPDGTWQLEQALGYRPWSNHHPAAHTAVIWLFYHLGRLFTDDTNQAVAVYTFAQMTFLAFSCAFAAGTLRRTGIRRRVCLIAAAFYALVPFHPVFGIIVSKDTPFACAGLLLTCVILRLLYLRGTNNRCADGKMPETRPSFGIQAGFVVTSILFCLFRSNGWYGYWLLIPVLLICMKGMRKRMLLLCAIAWVTAFSVRGPLLNSLGVIQPDFIESCCVPLQQISRVVADGRQIRPDEQMLIGEVVEFEYIDDIYNPVFADSMKELVRAGNQDYLTSHKKEFFSLWLSLGLRYPDEYVRAWADLTLGYWYPNVEYDTASIEGIWENMTDVYPDPLLRGAVFVKTRELLLRLGDFIPLYGLLWSSGTYTWLLMACAALMLSRRRDCRFLAVLAPSAAVLITLLIAAPISTSFRYTYMITLSMPVWLLTIFYACGDAEAVVRLKQSD